VLIEHLAKILLRAKLALGKKKKVEAGETAINGYFAECQMAKHSAKSPVDFAECRPTGTRLILPSASFLHSAKFKSLPSAMVFALGKAMS